MSQDFTAEFIQQVERVNLAFDRKMAELEERFQDMRSEEERISGARAASPAPPLDAHRPDGAWDEGPSSSASSGGGGARGAQPRHLELRRRQFGWSTSPTESPTASVGRGVSESEKMARLTELQKEQFQLVCKELYQDCLTLKQVCDLNFTGLSKALKKYTKSMRRLAKGGGDDAAAAAGAGAVTYSANLKEQPFYVGIKRLEKVVPVPEKTRAMERLPRHVACARHRRAGGVLLVSVRLCATFFFPEANPIPGTGRPGGGRDRGKLCAALHRRGHGPSAASAAPPAPTRPREVPPCPSRPLPVLCADAHARFRADSARDELGRGRTARATSASCWGAARRRCWRLRGRLCTRRHRTPVLSAPPHSFRPSRSTVCSSCPSFGSGPGERPARPTCRPAGRLLTPFDSGPALRMCSRSFRSTTPSCSR